jgi:hypothetical protein
VLNTSFRAETFTSWPACAIARPDKQTKAKQASNATRQIIPASTWPLVPRLSFL